MEGIFRSMAASGHRDEFKRQALHKMLANSLSAGAMPSPEVSPLLSLFVEWALVSDSPMLNLTGSRGAIQLMRFWQEVCSKTKYIPF